MQSLRLQFDYLSAAVLEHVSIGLPYVRTLSLATAGLADSDVQLPPPPHFPSLRDLTVLLCAASTQAAMWRSVIPFLTQLTSLTIHEQAGEARARAEHGEPDYMRRSFETPLRSPAWSRHLFCAVPRSTSLKKLALDYILHPHVCRLLQQHIPVSCPSPSSPHTQTHTRTPAGLWADMLYTVIFVQK